MWFEVFEDEINERHKNGFVHREIKRPSNISGLAFDNILLTENGLQLIDVGISALKFQVGEQIFNRYLEIERQEILELKEYFFNR